MDNPMKLTLEDIAKIIDGSAKQGVMCHIEFIPIKDGDDNAGEKRQ